MSKPFAAKGVGACLKHVLNTRLSAGGLATARRQAHGRRWLHETAKTMSVLGDVRAPLSESDPFPPDHDRSAILDEVLGELYRVERAGLLRYLTRRLPDQAEDLLQQLFTRMAAKPKDHVATIASPRAYLHQAARNLVRDHIRGAGRDPLQTPLDDRCPSADPVAALEARDRLARLEQAMLRLKPLTREIFLARRLDGYSYTEIAERTGLSVKGVEKQMSKAIKQLGRHLRHHD